MHTRHSQTKKKNNDELISECVDSQAYWFVFAQGKKVYYFLVARSHSGQLYCPSFRGNFESNLLSSFSWRKWWFQGHANKMHHS